MTIMEALQKNLSKNGIQFTTKYISGQEAIQISTQESPTHPIFQTFICSDDTTVLIYIYLFEINNTRAINDVLLLANQYNINSYFGKMFINQNNNLVILIEYPLPAFPINILQLDESIKFLLKLYSTKLQEANQLYPAFKRVL